jgi:hypothetical protein
MPHAFSLTVCSYHWVLLQNYCFQPSQSCLVARGGTMIRMKTRANVNGRTYLRADDSANA